LWFTDLAASDPTWIMPIAIGATNLFNVEVKREESIRRAAPAVD